MNKTPWPFLIRTAATVALLSVVYKEAGWATTLLLFFLLLRAELENIIYMNAIKNFSKKEASE